MIINNLKILNLNFKLKLQKSMSLPSYLPKDQKEPEPNIENVGALLKN